MKKYSAILASAAIALSLTACSALELLPDDSTDIELGFEIPSLPDLTNIEFVIPPEEDFEYIDAGSGFWRCYSRESNIEIPAELGGVALTELSDNMFGSEELVNIKIPDGVTKIGKSTFQDCANLEGVIIPDSMVKIDDHAFSDCKRLEGILIPEGVTKLGGFVFYNCTSLKSVVLPKSATDVGGVTGGVFYNCTSLLSVDLGSTEFVGIDYFKNCGALRAVYLSDNVKRINSAAFKDCPNVKVVYKGKTYSGETLDKLIKQINDEYDKEHDNGGDPFGK